MFALFVMPGFMPGIHVLRPLIETKAWMRGTSPRMTRRDLAATLNEKKQGSKFMAALLLSFAGAGAGGALFGASGAVIGRAVGALGGGLIDNALFGSLTRKTGTP